MTESCIYLDPNLVSWLSKKQTTVSRSSMEGEYRAIANVIAELKWLYSLMCDLGIRICRPPLILTESKSALFMAAKPVVQTQSRHINIDYHFACDLIIQGAIRINYILTSQRTNSGHFHKSTINGVIYVPLMRSSPHQHQRGVSKEYKDCLNQKSKAKGSNIQKSK